MKIKLSVFFTLLVCLVSSTLVYASPTSSLPNQYIVVLKENGFTSAGIKKITGESVEQVTKRLLKEANIAGRKFDEKHPTTQEVKNKSINIYKHALKGFSATLSEGSYRAMKKNKEVESIEQDGMAYPIAFQNPTQSWGQDRVDQRNLPLNQVYQYNTSGSGVHAYVIDTGIRATHNDFVGRVGNGRDLVENDNTPQDCNGHGTHVAGTIAGTQYGLAKQATLHSVRVFGCTGGSPWSRTIAAVDWVVANHIKPAVVNMSLSGGNNTAMDTAVNNAVAAGISFAVAAGNNYGANACTRSPARAANAITVGSTNNDDARSNFSNIGICVDIFAPGRAIKSAWFTSNTATNTISGTSMATPHIAGVIALHLENFPNATPAQVTASILAGATPNKITNVGTGSPNLLAYSILQPAPPQSGIDWLVPVIDVILN